LAKGIRRLTGGRMLARYLTGSLEKQEEWFRGVLGGREGYAAWVTHLSRGLRDSVFLEQFESITDRWKKSQFIGEKISSLKKSFRELSESQREELARESETEMKIGLQMLARDKGMLQQLLEVTADPPGE